MAATETLTRLSPYAERLAENEYVHRNLAEAINNLQAAYARVSKRGVAVTQEKKFYEQLRRSAQALAEAKAGVTSGRTKPRRWKRRIVMVVVGGAGAAGALALAANDELRASILGGAETEES